MEILFFLLSFLTIFCNDYKYADIKNMGREERINELLKAIGAIKNSCLESKQETYKILNEKYNISIKEKDINDNLRFIVGDCHPVILVPGIFSVRLRTQVDCKGLFENEKDVYQKLQFFCLSHICPNPNVKKIQ